jgi:hypothetical protein
MLFNITDIQLQVSFRLNELKFKSSLRNKFYMDAAERFRGLVKILVARDKPMIAGRVQLLLFLNK